MDPALLAHEIGLVGEGLNFVGALFVGRDLLNRSKERRKADNRRILHDLAAKANLTRTTYRQVDIGSASFVNSISDRYAARLGVTGMGIMALGFFCLASYHLIEIFS
jgi:hypothetical protein